MEDMRGTVPTLAFGLAIPLILHWLSQYGYFMIFGLLLLGILGVPVPDELLLLSSGYLCHQGRLTLPLAIPAAAVGSMCGISLSYLIGRFVGWPAIHRFGKFLRIRDRQVAATEGWFERWGKWTLLVAYFVPGVRHVVAILAGTSKMPWKHFAPFAYSGAIIWTSTFILVGYLLGPEAIHLAHYLHGYLTILAIVVVAGVIAFVIVRTLLRRARRRRGKGPEVEAH